MSFFTGSDSEQDYSGDTEDEEEDFMDYSGDTEDEEEEVDEDDGPDALAYLMTPQTLEDDDDEMTFGCVMAYRRAYENFVLFGPVRQPRDPPETITDDLLDNVFVKVKYRKEGRTLEEMFETHFTYKFLPYVPAWRRDDLTNTVLLHAKEYKARQTAANTYRGYMSLRDARDCTGMKWRVAWYGRSTVKAMGKSRRGRHGGFHYDDCSEDQRMRLERVDANERRLYAAWRDTAQEIRREKIKNAMLHMWTRGGLIK